MVQQALALCDLSFDDRCAAILANMSAPFASLLDLLTQADDAPQNEKRSKECDLAVAAQTYCFYSHVGFCKRA